MENQDILRRAVDIMDREAGAVRSAAGRLDGGFCRLVRDVAALQGKVLVSGVGKSGIVAEKLAATLSSTGTPAFFLHPLGALHGDLGAAREGDLLVAISNSGESEELLHLLEAARNLGVTAACITGRPGSTLAGLSDYVLDAAVEREACPLGLAPTASTTVALALSDALAMVVMELRGFRPADFARYHPGGALRRRLRLLVQDIMRTGDLLPVVTEDDTVAEALREMTEKETLGVTLVVDPDGALTGVLTDGDLRRMLLATGGIDDLRQSPVARYMGRRPKTVDPQAVASEALRVMEVQGITSLAIVDSRSRPAGILHLHDILGRGSFSI